MDNAIVDVFSSLVRFSGNRVRFEVGGWIKRYTIRRATCGLGGRCRRGDGPGNRPLSATPNRWQVQNLPKSRRGNPSEYSVGGERYAVLDSAEGFVEQGKASWYGRKFHGRETSSGEVYLSLIHISEPTRPY